MKTEIIYSYKPPEGFCINKVVTIDEQTIIILNWKYRTPSLIHILVNNSIIKQINLSDFKDFDSSDPYNAFFKYKNGFGLVNNTDIVLLCEDIYSTPVLINISNPFPADSFGRRHTAKFADYYQENQSLYFGIEEISSGGYPARHWAKLEITQTSNEILSAKWNCLYELPIRLYPETKLRPQLEKEKSWDYYIFSRKNDWLNINNIMVKNNLLFIPTDGGRLTRAKSGIQYEYSLISVLNLENRLIANHEIEEGKGNFTFSKDKYLLNSRSKRNKIFIYNTEDFQIESEITISPKQNLGTEKNMNLSTNIVGETFYLYNGFFLNLCIIV